MEPTKPPSLSPTQISRDVQTICEKSEELQKIVSGASCANDRLISFTGQIAFRLRIWGNDLLEEPSKKNLLQSVPEAVALLADHLAEVNDVMTSFGKAVTSIMESETEADMSSLVDPAHSYDCAVRTLIKLRRAPLDPSMRNVLQLYRQSLKDLQKPDFAFEPDSDSDAQDAEKGHSAVPIEIQYYPDIPEDRKFRRRPRDESVSLSSSTEASQHAMPGAKELEDVYKALVEEFPEYQASKMNYHDFTNALIDCDQEEERSREGEIDTYRSSLAADDALLLHTMFEHFFRIHATVTQMVVFNETPEVRTTPLWTAFTPLIHSFGKDERMRERLMASLRTLHQSLPKNHWYSETYGPFEQYGLSHYVVALFNQVTRFGISLRTRMGLDDLFKLSSDDLEIQAQAVRSISLEIDKAALKERIVSNVDLPPTSAARRGGVQAIASPMMTTISGSVESKGTGDTAPSSVTSISVMSDELDDSGSALGASNVQFRKPIHDPPQSMLEPVFTGRIEELETLVDALYTPTQSHTVRILLHGWRAAVGRRVPVGKTQIVIRLVASLQATTPDIAVFWLTAATPATIDRSLEQTFSHIKGYYPWAESQWQRTLAVKGHLRELDRSKKSWLLVVDGLTAGGLTYAEQLIPKTCIRGRVIYTSNDSQVTSELLGGRNSCFPIPIGPMTDKDAANLAVAFAALEATDENLAWAERVSKRSGNAPLPLKIIGGLVRRFKDIPLDKCEQIMDQHQFDLASTSASAPEPMVHALLLYGLEYLKVRRNDVHAMLCTLAFFDSDSIPFGPIVKDHFYTDGQNPEGADTSLSELQRRLSDAAEPDDQDTPGPVEIVSAKAPQISSYLSANDRKSTEEIITKLLKDLEDRDYRRELGDQLLATPMVEKRSNVAKLTLRMHQAARSSILASLKNSAEADTFFGVALKLYDGALNRLGTSLKDPDTWRGCSILLPHLDSFLALCDPSLAQNSSVSTTLMNATSRLCDYLYASGQYKSAVRYLQKCREVCRQQRSMHLIDRIARSYQKDDQFVEAHKAYCELLSCDDEANFELSDQNIRSAQGLASNYYLRGWLLSAEKLFLRLKDSPSVVKDPLLLAKIEEGLGNTYQRLGQPKEAFRYYGSSEKIHMQRNSFLPLMRIKYNIARLQRDLGHLSKAQAAFELILKEYAAHDLQEHPDALLVAGRLANTLTMRRQYINAEHLARSTLIAQMKLPNPPWVAIAYTYWTLAGVYAHTETHPKQLKTLAYLSLALEAYEEYLPKGHMFTLDVRRNLSHHYQLQNKLDEAAEVLEDAQRDAPEAFRGSAAAAELARIYDWQAEKAKAELEKRRDEQLRSASVWGLLRSAWMFESEPSNESELSNDSDLSSDSEWSTHVRSFQRPEFGTRLRRRERKNEKIRQRRLKKAKFSFSGKAFDLAYETWKIQKERLGIYHPDYNYTLWVLARIYAHRGEEGDHEEARIMYIHAKEGYYRISGEVTESYTAVQQEYDAFIEARKMDKELHLELPRLRTDTETLVLREPPLDSHGSPREYRGNLQGLAAVSDMSQLPLSMLDTTPTAVFPAEPSFLAGISLVTTGA